MTGETIWRVPSLSVPDPQRLPPLDRFTDCEAVRLFIDRAVASAPQFAVTNRNAPAVAQICYRLDGIPLAIELAAARVKGLTVEQIASRLGDRFHFLTGGGRTALPRHQTLRAAMDWSYGLLAEPEQVLLRRLSVFAGGFTLEAAEAVCAGDTLDESNVLDLLLHLVDKSLIVAEDRETQARYRLLDTVRQYGWDRLQESRETDDVQRRHRDWYLGLAEWAEPRLHGPEQTACLERLEAEHDNLRAALEWSDRHEEAADAGLRLAGALEWFWIMRGHWSEGRRWLEESLAKGKDASRSCLPKAFRGTAHLAWRQGDYARATTVCEEGLTLCRELGDQEGTAWLLDHLGVVASLQGDHRRAASLYEDALALCRALGDKWHISIVVGNLGTVARMQGDYERAVSCYDESLALARAVRDKWTIGWALRNQGVAASLQGDYERAAPFFRESLTLCREVKDKWVAEECLVGLAGVAGAQGEYEKAARLFGAAEVLREILGRQPAPRERAYHDHQMTSTRAALGDAAFAAWAEGRAMTLEQAIEYALAEEPDG